jgi:HK97 family phage major capsid protein
MRTPNRPPAWMRSLLRKGLALAVQRPAVGFPIDALRMAERLADGETPTPDDVRRAATWLTRNAATKADGWDADGAESDAYVAHLLHGEGGSGRGLRWWLSQEKGLRADDEADEATKAGRRHSARDEALIRRSFTAAQAIAADMQELGYADEDAQSETAKSTKSSALTVELPEGFEGDPVAYIAGAFAQAAQALAAEKGLNYDQEARRVRDAWYLAHGGNDGTPPASWVETVFEDAVIVSDGGELYRVPYADDGERITFAERALWVGVRQTYLTDDGAEVKLAAPLAALPDGPHPGAMIALILPMEARAQLRAAAGNAVTQEPDHCTLLYLTDDADALAAGKNRLLAALAHCAAMLPPLRAEIGGSGRFAPITEGGESAIYASLDSPDLPALRAAVESAARGCGCLGEQTHGFTPHITLGYLGADDPTPSLHIPRIPITFAALTLVWGGERMDFPFQGCLEPVALAASVHELTDDAEAVLREALAMPKAADTPPTATADELVYAGEAVKSLGGGRIGGYLVRFSGPDDPDLAGDFFTKDTDFGPHQTSLVYYHHGQDGTLKRRLLDPAAKLRKDDFGVWVEAQLSMRDEYERWLLAEAEKGRLGWSSGTAGHLTERVPVRGAHWIKSWPLGLDASLTPIPCEPRARAVPLKSLAAPAVSPATVPAAPAVITPTRSARMDEDQIKAMLAEAMKGLGAELSGTITQAVEQAAKARDEAAAKSIDERLKAIEDSPAVKSAGYVSMDGGENDKHVKSFGDWLLAVKRRDTRRLERVYKSAWQDGGGEGASTKDLGEGSGASGGYLVPVEYEPMLEKIAVEAAIVEPRARQIRMSSATKLVPMLKQTSNPGANQGDSAFFGGVSFVWNAEGADISNDKSDPVFDMVEFIARKLTGLTVASNEIVEDASSLETDLLRLFGEGLAHARDFFYLRGNGVGRPLGILNSPARYTVSRKSSGNDIEIEDIGDMLSRLTPMSIRNAVWVANPLAIADIITLKIGDSPVWQPDARVEVGGTLMGRPLLFSEYLPAVGSAGDLILCDFQYYGVATRRGIVIASSEHARFDTDQVTWRVTYRGDGKPLLDSTVKLADGSTTEVSPFVVLGS